MTIFSIKGQELIPLEKVRFSDRNFKERSDLQQMLKRDINVLFGDTPDYEVMLIDEEFSGWKGSQRSIDLLGLDSDANPVVIELKRTETGAHMELQAMRYAAMVSTITFERLVEIHEAFIKREYGEKPAGERPDARREISDFLDKAGKTEADFGNDVRIVLASADFSGELTATVMWLNSRYGMNIRCIRMMPYGGGEDQNMLIDIHTFIPVPEATDYLESASAKEQSSRAARINGRDYTKYDVTIDGKTHRGLAKRNVIYVLMKAAFKSGAGIERLIETAPHRGKRLFQKFDGVVPFDETTPKTGDSSRRYFTGEDEKFLQDGKTYFLTNQWGGEQFQNTKTELLKLLTGKAEVVECP